jgi:hypothetical protein
MQLRQYQQGERIEALLAGILTQSNQQAKSAAALINPPSQSDLQQYSGSVPTSNSSTGGQ